jgi:hypothetical protein
MPGAALPAATEAPATIAPAEPGSAGLLAPLRLQSGPGGAPRAVKAAEFLYDGMQYSNWSDAPSMTSPDTPTALRLIADGAHPMAYAAFDIAPQSDSFAALPKRLHVEIQAVPAGAGAEPLPLEYYVGLPNYTATTWRWLGPFSTNYEPLINSAGQRDRYFDLNGHTTVLIAIPAGEAGAARAADLLKVGYSTAGAYVAVRPYRLKLEAAQLGSAIISYAVFADGSYLPDNCAQIMASASGSPSVFQDYGFTSVELQRLDPDTGQFAPAATSELLGSDPDYAYAVDAAGNLPAPLLPGDKTTYAVRLVNAAGSTPLTEPATLTTTIIPPAVYHWNGEGEVLLSWNRQYGVEGFEIYRDDALLAQPDVNTTSYTDSGMVPNLMHTYRIRAIRGTDYADSIPLVTAAAYPRPQWVQIQPGSGVVHLAWSMGYPPAGFELYRNDQLLQSFGPDEFSYDDTDVQPLQRYTYQLKANVPPEQLETPPLAVLVWSWPAYFLAPTGESTAQGGGELADLAGHPGLLASFGPSGRDGEATAGFNFYEAVTGNVADSPTAWTATARSIPLFEPQGSQAQSFTAIDTGFCSLNGQPVCVAHSVFASFSQFGTALTMRAAGAAPPGNPTWIDSYAPTESVVEALSLGSAGGRLQMAWRDDYTLKLHYARAQVEHPASSADWLITTAGPPDDYECSVGELGGLPAMAVRNLGKLVLFRATSADPAAPADWTRLELLSGLPTSTCHPQFGLVGGKPWITYYDVPNHVHRFARATTADPALPSDWVHGQVYASPAGLNVPLRFVDYNGRCATAYADDAGGIRFAVSADGSPSGPADWTATLVETEGSSRAPSLVYSGGQLYLSFMVGGPERMHGWHIMLPPNTI